ncbi:MAG: DUF1653 domain-containing protein [Clostridiales bacterium]|nr:DUF1653 domain-containing protein [Clostridiales bacterium]
MREVRQGQFYRHFKDRLYQIVAVAEHSETGEQMVVYQALYGDYRIYVRPYEMFVSEVDREKYPEVKQRYRFELVELQKEPMRPEGQEQQEVNPILLEFLDAETLEEKMHIMAFHRNQMDDELLNSIAISLDLVVEKESIQEKYQEILNCLSMMEKFECNRLR